MATEDFSLYDVIIIASDQVPGFHVNFATSFLKFIAFIAAGWTSGCIGVKLPGDIRGK
jgi:hypothetical protein